MTGTLLTIPPFSSVTLILTVVLSPPVNSWFFSADIYISLALVGEVPTSSPLSGCSIPKSGAGAIV